MFNRTVLKGAVIFFNEACDEGRIGAGNEENYPSGYQSIANMATEIKMLRESGEDIIFTVTKFSNQNRKFDTLDKVQEELERQVTRYIRKRTFKISKSLIESIRAIKKELGS